MWWWCQQSDYDDGKGKLFLSGIGECILWIFPTETVFCLEICKQHFSNFVNYIFLVLSSVNYIPVSACCNGIMGQSQNPTNKQISRENWTKHGTYRFSAYLSLQNIIVLRFMYKKTFVLSTTTNHTLLWDFPVMARPLTKQSLKSKFTHSGVFLAASSINLGLHHLRRGQPAS